MLRHFWEILGSIFVFSYLYNIFALSFFPPRGPAVRLAQHTLEQVCVCKDKNYWTVIKAWRWLPVGKAGGVTGFPVQKLCCSNKCELSDCRSWCFHVSIHVSTEMWSANLDKYGLKYSVSFVGKVLVCGWSLVFSTALILLFCVCVCVWSRVCRIWALGCCPDRHYIETKEPHENLAGTEGHRAPPVCLSVYP